MPPPLERRTTAGPPPLVLAKEPTASGDAQTGPVSEALPNDLRIIVTRDGSPQSGVTVNWSILTGGGTLSATATVTDPTGTASVDYTTGATPGQVVIQASAAAGVLIITFNVTVA